MITILEGSTFCISDERGDMSGSTGGFFAADTRRLSRFVLTINGERPLLLSSGQVEYFSAAFYLRNPLADLPQDSLSIARSRFVGDSMQERIVIRKGKHHPWFFIAEASEKEVLTKLGRSTLLHIYGGAALCLACLAYLVNKFGLWE